MSDKWRQRLHLEPPQGWMNDPNGLCWFDGSYHVYFQYCPSAANGSGPKYWGHYRSPDLLHWKFCGTVLRPDIPEDRDGVYSGSALEANGTLHLFYTGNVKEEGAHDYITSGRGANVIHVTTRDGDKMSEKHVLLTVADYPAACTQHVRDPKVWQQDGAWHMVLGARARTDAGLVLVYHSDDLVRWQYAGAVTTPEPFGYMWECPDYYILDGKGVLSVSPQGLPHFAERFQNVYQSGWFAVDGALTEGCLGTFTEWDMGFDFYAPQSFEVPDGRRIMIGWMGLPDIDYRNPTVSLGWQHCLTLPRELAWDGNGRLCQHPVRELTALRGEMVTIHDGETRKVPLPFDLEAEIHGDFSVTLANAMQLQYNAADGVCTLAFTDCQLGAGRTKRTAKLPECRRLRMLADTSSAEIYLEGGACVFSTRYYPDETCVTLRLSGAEGTLWHMNSPEVTCHAT